MRVTFDWTLRVVKTNRCECQSKRIAFERTLTERKLVEAIDRLVE